MATKRSELSEIKRFGGKPQKNSGRGFQKGDATWGVFLVDVKEYLKTFSLSRTVWGKISTDAAKHGKEPALMICLGEGKDTIRLWVVGDQMMQELKEAFEDKNGG